MDAPGDIVLWGDEATSLAGWTAQASPGSSARLEVVPGASGTALRFDFELVGPTSWAIARRSLSAALPPHYVAHLRLRGEAEPQELQLKLVDPEGRNVWWWRRRPLAFSGGEQELVLRKAGLEFAWGPASGGEPAALGAVELALAAGSGGRGTLILDALRIEAREAPRALPPAPSARASSAAVDHGPERALEPDDATSWRPAAGDAAPWLELDLGASCELGGLTVDFEGAPAPACRLAGSPDGERWTLLAEAPAGRPGPRWLRCHDEARFLRLELAGGAAAGVRRVGLVELEHALAPARHAARLARAAPRGDFPRHLLDEQAPWCVVGADGDDRKGLLGEDGALEVGVESFSIEPFLWSGGKLASWADALASASLADGSLPVPTVAWEAAGLRLRITACAAGPAGASSLVARYALENPGPERREARLFLAVRPYQVTPVWQSLHLAGGFAPLTSVEADADRLRVNGAWSVLALPRPAALGARHAGDEPLASWLARGRTPPRVRAEDALGLAEGALAFDFALAAGERAAVGVVVPLHPAASAPPTALAPGEAQAWLDARIAETEARWRARLALPFALPPGAADFEDSARASLAWLLVNRDGPRLQPGPRAYRRSWIRDGAFGATTLAEMGFADEARAFLRWYAPHQLADGRVPCAVDRTGVDPVPEHDSHGQLIWATVEVYRLTGDRGFLAELWPRLLRAVDAIERLRAQRTGADRRGTPSFGLLPESISHEGYSSQPVHSYWDDFFALRGLTDAADAAAALGDGAQARRIAALRDALREDVRVSLERTMAQHRIDVPAGLGGARRLRPHLDRRGARPVRRGGVAAPRPAGAHLPALPRGVRRAPQRRLRRGVLHPL